MIASIEAGIQSLGQSGNHKEIEALNDDLETLKDIQQIFYEELKVASAEYQKQRAAGKTDDAGISLSAKDDFSEYNKPITEADIQKLRAIGRKSINEFTDKEIEATQKWAYKFWENMSEPTKSPFFRRWFGDWRAYETASITVANKKNIGNNSKINNNDTGWKINVPGRAVNETTHHNNSASKAAVSYLPYLDSIVENAILLNTETSDKGGQSLFYHYMYCIANIGNGKELLKLEVEEMNDPNADDDIHRAYKLLNIENWQTGVGSSQNNSASLITQSANVKTISDLFNAVKSKDKAFNPKPVNKEFINSDGTPKIFYHGTPNGTFTEFRDWQYFTPNEDYAGNYLNQGASSNGYKKNADNPKVYAAYQKQRAAGKTDDAGISLSAKDDVANLKKWGIINTEVQSLPLNMVMQSPARRLCCIIPRKISLKSGKKAMTQLFLWAWQNPARRL